MATASRAAPPSGRRGALAAAFALLLACLAVLALAGAALAEAGVTVAATPEGEPICVTCHEDVSRNVVTTWRSQNHGQKGIGCERCHNSHTQDFTPFPMAKVCFGCHDVATIHPDFTVTTPGATCMECHTANVHWYPDESSWFQGGLPSSELDQPTEQEPDINASTGRAAGVVVVVVAVIVGLAVGLIFNRFVRDL